MSLLIWSPSAALAGAPEQEKNVPEASDLTPDQGQKNSEQEGPAGGEDAGEGGDAQEATGVDAAREPVPKGGEPAQSEPVTGPGFALTEAEVKAVEVSLEVWRGGDRLPEGKRVARRKSVVDGRARYQLSAPSVAGQRLVLLDYAEVLREEPRELDEIALETYIAGVAERARLEVTVARAQGQTLEVSRSGGRRDIVVELPAGVESVELEYRVEVPRRYWPLGCVWRRCSLSGGVAPLPSEAAEGGVWLPAGGRVIQPAQWQVDARFGVAPDYVPGSEASEEQAELIGKHELIVTDEALDPRAPIAYPSVFWGPGWRHSTAWVRGVKVEVLHIDPRPGDQFPSENVLHPLRDAPGHVQAIARDALELGAAVGIEPPPDTQITVIQGPIRSDVAMFHPSAIMLSDQYLQLFATARLAKFHDILVARALFEQLSYGHFSGRHDPSTELWLAGAYGVALTQLWQRGKELRDEYATDLLSSFTFVPTIDSFLYTGQAAFSSAYFRGSEDKWPVRNHPLFFANELPSGRRIHEKLSDLLSDAQLAELYAELGQGPDNDPRRLAERVWGHELGWFFDQWLGPYPEVDYAISDVASTRQADGSWTHRITIARDGELPLVEPVQLLVTERGGEQHYLVWNGEAEPGKGLVAQPAKAEHVFELETARKLKFVRLDPRARLVESSRIPTGRNNRGDNNDPLFNNRVPVKGRFLYAGFGLELSASELASAQTPQARLQAVNASFAFLASARRDMRSSAYFRGFTSRETNLGGSASYTLRFGRKRNRQFRRMSLTLGSSVSWLTNAGLDPAGGIRATQSATFVHSTRKFGTWPESGHVLYFTASGSQIVRTDGATDHRYALELDTGWRQKWRLAHHHVLATNIDAAILIPIASDPEFRSLLRGGGREGLIGFTSNELFGRALVRGLVEYRHVIVDNLRIPLLNVAFIRTITGSVFGGVTTLSSCDDYSGWFGRGSWYGQVGYGLAGRFQWFGVTPELIRMNVSVPLGRRSGTTCLGETLPDYLGEVQGFEGDVSALLPPVSIDFTYSHLF